MITIIKPNTFTMKINNPKLLLTPLFLATTVAFANWGADSQETPMNNVTSNDEDRAAFIDLSKMVAAGDLEVLKVKSLKQPRIKALGLLNPF